jgi:hypothetical protein
LLFVTNDVWSETVVSWNTQPAPGQALTNWPMSSAGTDRVEVTALALSEVNGDGRLSLGLQVFDPFADPVYSFGSRESTEELRPRLILELTDASLSFDEWIAGFTNLASLAPHADPDGDRLTNAEEFLFVRDPAQPDGSTVLTIDSDSDGVRLSYPQRKSLPPGFYYVIETTPGLSPTAWQLAAGVEFIGTDGPHETRLMNALIPRDETSQGCYRLRIVPGP